MTERGYDVYTNPEYQEVNSRLTRMDVAPAFNFLLAIEFGLLSVGLSAEIFPPESTNALRNTEGFQEINLLLAGISLVMIPIRIYQARSLFKRRNEMLDQW